MVLHTQGIWEKESDIEMTVEEVLNCMEGPDRIKIVSEDGTELYRGYQGTMKRFNGKQIEFNNDTVDMSAEVVKIGLFIEIYRREKREEILASTEGNVPMPDMITNISYGDLEQCIYTKIVTKK